jgi:hypothetical protein
MLMNNRLGCFSTTALIAAVITALILASIAFASGSSMFSPGDLNSFQGKQIGGVFSHAEIGKECSKCHTSFWTQEKMADRCIQCHTDVAEQLADTKSLHGILRINDPKMNCRNCHPDHRGPSESLTVVSFGFPHDQFGFSLATHPKTSCADCHAGNYIGFDSLTCINCHKSLDTGFMTAHMLAYGVDCLGCHDGIESLGKTFDHSKTQFPLTGLHTNLICTKCHLNARNIADLKNTSVDCINCHANDEPHDGRFGTDCGSCHNTSGWKPAKFDHDLANFKLNGKHTTIACELCHTDGKYKGTPSTCGSCHLKDDAHQAKLGTDCGLCHTTDGWKPSTFDHNLSIFKLTGGHLNAQCTQCHQDKTFKGTPTTCGSCHLKDDAHQGQFGTDCGLCHSTTAWKPATFDHNQSAFKLTGAHLNAQCAQCHMKGVFKGTPKFCGSCHVKDDNHNGRFGTDCGACHSTSAWKPATFDHNLSSFKLTGAHANLACGRCHSKGFSGTSSSCASCHGDPSFHSGMFGNNCGSCHNTSNWNASYNGPHPSFGEHGGINHEGASCRDCHTQNLSSATCLKCHDSNNPGDGGGGGGGGGDD